MGTSLHGQSRDTAGKWCVWADVRQHQLSASLVPRVLHATCTSQREHGNPRLRGQATSRCVPAPKHFTSRSVLSVRCLRRTQPGVLTQEGGCAKLLPPPTADTEATSRGNARPTNPPTSISPPPPPRVCPPARRPLPAPPPPCSPQASRQPTPGQTAPVGTENGGWRAEGNCIAADATAHRELLPPCSHDR